MANSACAEAALDAFGETHQRGEAEVNVGLERVAPQLPNSASRRVPLPLGRLLDSASCARRLRARGLAQPGPRRCWSKPLRSVLPRWGACRPRRTGAGARRPARRRREAKRLLGKSAAAAGAPRRCAREPLRSGPRRHRVRVGRASARWRARSSADGAILASRAWSDRRRAGVWRPATAEPSSGCVNRSCSPSSARILASSASASPRSKRGTQCPSTRVTSGRRAPRQCVRPRAPRRRGRRCARAAARRGRWESGALRRARACRLVAGARLRARARRRGCRPRSPRA